MEKKEYFDENGCLTDKGLIELRKQVCVGSLDYSDYSNNLQLTTESVLDFFEGYTDYLQKIADKHNDIHKNDEDFARADWYDYDDDSHLIDYWWNYIDEDPFVKDDPEEIKEDRRLRAEYPFLKVGAYVRVFDAEDVYDGIYKVTGIEDELWENLTLVHVKNDNCKDATVFIEDIEELRAGDSEEVKRMERMDELINKYERNSWQRDFFANCCDDLNYGYYWGWIKENDGFVSEYGEKECREVYDAAYEYMSIAA
jgi:hypothetical protein